MMVSSKEWWRVRPSCNPVRSASPSHSNGISAGIRADPEDTEYRSTTARGDGMKYVPGRRPDGAEFVLTERRNIPHFHRRRISPRSECRSLSIETEQQAPPRCDWIIDLLCDWRARLPVRALRLLWLRAVDAGADADPRSGVWRSVDRSA
ncbi:hypothetical protein FQA47_020620 [Oryzias melastigma]|uniref:Uncharacterized protein n=1 Tax=Oryzias melastigma TaxID=30732 RepID=A0A834C8W2_ORYME|nr:hypothetical protein FQA47_020620 [Oryzias melastigma]